LRPWKEKVKLNQQSNGSLQACNCQSFIVCFFSKNNPAEVTQKRLCKLPRRRSYQIPRFASHSQRSSWLWIHINMIRTIIRVIESNWFLRPFSRYVPMLLR